MRRIATLIFTLIAATTAAGGFSYTVASNDRLLMVYLFSVVGLGIWIVLNGLINTYKQHRLVYPRWKQIPTPPTPPNNL